MSKEVIITRKIQLLFNTEDKEEVTKHWEKLYQWRYIIYRAANMISSNHYIQDQIKDMFYLVDDVKVKLSSQEKDIDGILTTSKMNTTYQVLSKKFKGDIPTSILTSLNSTIVRTYMTERKDYFTGRKSLRSYRTNIPIPVRTQDFRQVQKQEKYTNYTFNLYGFPFRTNFGRDLSENRIIWERWQKNEYKLCDSSIQILGNKIFLLAVFQFDKELYQVDKEIKAECYLDVETPMIVVIDGRKQYIGNKEEYLHQRIGIQGAVRRVQRGLRFTSGGSGRTRKLQALDRFHLAEKNYIITKVHQYSSKLINLCLKDKAGTIVLKNQEAKEKEAKEDVQFLLRNWGYFSLKEKIKYKAEKVGIEVIEE